MKKEKEEILKEIVERCKHKFGKNLIAIVLFGSAVTNTSKKSDYDILAVASNLPSHFKERDNLLLDLITVIKKPIDLILITPEEFDNAIMNLSPLFLSISQQKYKVLYGKDIIASGINKLKNFFVIKRISELGWKVQEVENVQ